MIQGNAGKASSGNQKTAPHRDIYLNNISQSLIGRSTPHLRQIIEFSGGESSGVRKDDYAIRSEYRELVQQVLHQIRDGA